MGKVVSAVAGFGFVFLLFYIFVFTEYRELVDKEFDRSGEELVITVHTYDNYDEVTEAFRNHLGDDIDKVSNPDHQREGWATWSPDDNKCDIHVVVPKYAYRSRELETWGHELAHCVYGRFHE